MQPVFPPTTLAFLLIAPEFLPITPVFHPITPVPDLK